jgi:hypothetical protein
MRGVYGHVAHELGCSASCSGSTTSRALRPLPYQRPPTPARGNPAREVPSRGHTDQGAERTSNETKRAEPALASSLLVEAPPEWTRDRTFQSTHPACLRKGRQHAPTQHNERAPRSQGVPSSGLGIDTACHRVLTRTVVETSCWELHTRSQNCKGGSGAMYPGVGGCRAAVEPGLVQAGRSFLGLPRTWVGQQVRSRSGASSIAIMASPFQRLVDAVPAIGGAGRASKSDRRGMTVTAARTFAASLLTRS